MHELKLAAFHVPYICISKNNYFVNNFYYHSSPISRNSFVWDRHDLNHYMSYLLCHKNVGSKLLRPTIWHAFTGSKNIITEFMQLSGKKEFYVLWRIYNTAVRVYLFSLKITQGLRLYITSRYKR
jgi:hypothetical protein